RLWSNFYILITLNIFKCFFETEDDGGDKFYLVIRTRSSHICKLLTLCYIHCNVSIAVVFAHYLSHIDFFLGENKELASVLEFFNCISVSSSTLHGYQ